MNKFFLFCLFTLISMPLSGGRRLRHYDEKPTRAGQPFFDYLKFHEGDRYAYLSPTQINDLNQWIKDHGSIIILQESDENEALTLIFDKNSFSIKGVFCGPKTNCVNLCDEKGAILSPCTINHNPPKKRYYAGLCIGFGALCFLGYYFRDSLVHCARNPFALSTGIKSLFGR